MSDKKDMNVSRFLVLMGLLFLVMAVIVVIAVSVMPEL
jgi:hypothetical protein